MIRLVDQNLVKQVLAGIIRKQGPSVLNSENRDKLLFQLGAGLAARPNGIYVPESVNTVVRYLPGDPRGKAQMLPGKQVLINGKIVSPEIDGRYYQVIEVPESGGAAGVTLIYGRLISLPDFAGSSSSNYAAILPYALRADPGADWITSTAPYALGFNMVYDDGAGKVISFSNGSFGKQKSQPLVIKKDDTDGKYYITIIYSSGAYSVQQEVRYAIRCRVFRYLDDPLVKGKVPSLDSSPSSIGAIPTASAIDLGGIVVPINETGSVSVGGYTISGSVSTVLQDALATSSPEMAAMIRRMLGI